MISPKLSNNLTTWIYFVTTSTTALDLASHTSWENCCKKMIEVELNLKDLPMDNYPWADRGQGAFISRRISISLEGTIN
jgi:hypothetical protein